MRIDVIGPCTGTGSHTRKGPDSARLGPAPVRLSYRTPNRRPPRTAIFARRLVRIGRFDAPARSRPTRVEAGLEAGRRPYRRWPFPLFSFCVECCQDVCFVLCMLWACHGTSWKPLFVHSASGGIRADFWLTVLADCCLPIGVCRLAFANCHLLRCRTPLSVHLGRLGAPGPTADLDRRRNLGRSRAAKCGTGPVRQVPAGTPPLGGAQNKQLCTGTSGRKGHLCRPFLPPAVPGRHVLPFAAAADRHCRLPI